MCTPGKEVIPSHFSTVNKPTILGFRKSKPRLSVGSNFGGTLEKLIPTVMGPSGMPLIRPIDSELDSLSGE